MQIKRSIEKIPGGMMLVPLFLGALCHTFSPGAGKYFGSFTNGMITGTVPILAVWFFCMGASIKLSATGTVLRKSGTLVVTKIAVAWVVAAIASRIIPEHGVEVGFFAGLSTLALVAAMDMTNGGLYASIMQQYGTKEEAGAFVLMSLESGPLMTMIILGTAGLPRLNRMFSSAQYCRSWWALPWGTLTLSYENFSAKRCRRLFHSLPSHWAIPLI